MMIKSELLSDSENTEYSGSLIGLVDDGEVDNMVGMRRLVMKEDDFVACVHSESDVVVVHVGVGEETEHIQIVVQDSHLGFAKHHQ